MSEERCPKCGGPEVLRLDDRAEYRCAACEHTETLLARHVRHENERAAFAEELKRLVLRFSPSEVDRIRIIFGALDEKAKS